jgi:hypothetical protein
MDKNICVHQTAKNQFVPVPVHQIWILKAVREFFFILYQKERHSHKVEEFFSSLNLLFIDSILPAYFFL